MIVGVEEARKFAVRGRSAGRGGALRAAADGSDGTRTRDLRRDRAALVVAKALQTRKLGAAAVTFPSPFLRSAGGRGAPQAPASRLMPVSIQDAIDVILLRGSDRLITLIGSTIGARELVKRRLGAIRRSRGRSWWGRR